LSWIYLLRDGAKKPLRIHPSSSFSALPEQSKRHILGFKIQKLEVRVPPFSVRTSPSWRSAPPLPYSFRVLGSKSWRSRPCHASRARQKSSIYTGKNQASETYGGLSPVGSLDPSHDVLERSSGRTRVRSGCSLRRRSTARGRSRRSRGRISLRREGGAGG
jgi:hypothetical protein